jgi:3-methyladenine DNA glycosylase AlkD
VRVKRTSARARSARTVSADVADILARLERLGSKRVRDEMATRYGIHAKKAFGVKVAQLHTIAKPHRGDHALALALWKTGVYEARMVAVFVDDPAQVTPAQMESWCDDFDNWAICDTACFHLFDRTPDALKCVAKWARRKDEFGKRAAFALLASVALHRNDLKDADLLRRLPLIERAAGDDRNFVKKGVLWALRGIGKRKGACRDAALALAEKLAGAEVASARWVGKGALREMGRARP